MELANIEKILEKYLNGETSLQEEATLKTYFSSKNVAPEHEEYIPLFLYFKSSKEDTFTKTIQLNSKKTNWKWLSVAASVALLVSVYFGKQKYDEYVVKKQYAQVSKALKLLSTNLKKGEAAIANLYVYENTVNKILK